MPSSKPKRRRSFWSWFGTSEPNRRVERRLAHRRLVQEPLESRMLLSVSPTRIALDSAVVADPRDFVQIGDVSYFTAQDSTHGRELWVTDGTQDGTHLVKDIKPGANPSNPKELVEFNGLLYFVADDGVNGEELWRSDGTTAGTVMVKDINPGEGNQYPYGFGILSSFPRDLTVIDGVLYFSAEDNTHGAELWRSDGTAEGTVMVKDIFTGTFTDSYGTYPNSSNPANLVNVGGTLFFTAYDDDHGWELWTSDGTETGTRLVKDIFTGTFTDTDGTYPNSSTPSQLTDVDGVLYFVADDGAHGLELWKSDGTEAGTTMVEDIRAGTGDAFGERIELIAMNGILYFAADNGIVGDELWRSDGTTEGTYLLKDVKPGSEGNLSYFTGFTVVDDHLFFSADDGTHGRELWKTDGTEQGTALVADIALGTSSSYPFYMTAVDGILYFSAYKADTGRELWQSDGTKQGTVLVADGAPGTVGLYPRGMQSVGGFLVFAGYAPDVGRELYSIDYSAAVEDVARLSIWIDGQKISLDAEIGVYTDETTATVYTIDASGEILVVPNSGATLADFFEIWRTDAGGAGNNADATFDGQTLMGHVADTTYTVQMFVNGEVCDDFENYVIRNRDEIVLVYSENPVLALNTNYGPIVIELFGEDTPITVANFLTYVNDGDYIQSFIHRSVPNFVIQGGGFTTDTTYFTDTTQFHAIVTNPPIVNEPGISNTRGTLAMAKVGGNPDSATSQFFVNLANNSANLDSQNGGFTVFGHVLDMYTVDLIASLPIDTTNASPYSELPYSDAGDLVVFESIAGLGRITGYKFHDANINDQFDAGDTPIAAAVIYVDANNNGQRDAGEIWTTTDENGKYLLQIAPGEYILRSEVTSGNTGIVDSIPLTVQIGIELTDVDFGEVNLSVPASVVLAAGSDTGAADDDNLTRLNNADPASTLQFVVAGVFDGAVVRVYADGVVIGVATASGDTVTVTTDGGTVLADGEHLITATQTIGGGESEHSEPLTVTIDTIPSAAIQSTAPEYAQILTPYAFDADSPDEGGEGILYSLRDAPAGMTIDPATGQIAWTPATDQDGPHQFDIVVSDAAGNESIQTVNLTALGEIAAYPDAYTMEEDGVLTVSAEEGVLANDDPEEQFGPLTVSLIAGPAHGTLVLNEDGSFVYTPDADFFGTDTFTYRATDGDRFSNVALVTITVTNVNDAPVGQEDSYTTAEDTTLTVTAPNGVLANDSDPDDDALTAILVTGPSHGTLALNANGSFTYTPNADYHGTDSFTYRASDGTLESDPVTVTITITVTAVDDPPVAVNDFYTVNEDQVLTVTAANGVLTNDTDSDTPHANLTAVLVANPSHGTVTLNANGSFTYTPSANFAGTDTFTYRASDGVSNSSPATVTITVLNVADPPAAVNDSLAVVNTGATHVLNVLANDHDPDPGDAITLVSVTQGSSGGAVAVSGGSVNYTPTTGFVGQETFTYTIRDNDGQQATATVTVTVAADTSTGNASIAGFAYLDANGDGAKNTGEVGIPGVLVTLTGTTTGGSSVTRTVLTGDDGSFLFANLAAGTYSLAETQPAAMKDGLDSASDTAAVVGNDSIGNIVLAAGQARTGYLFGEQALLTKYVTIRMFLASTPPTEVWLREVVACGEDDAGNDDLAAQIRDGSQTIENVAPVAVANSYSTTQGTTLTVNAASGVLANDTDADGDTLSAILVTGPASGTLSLAANGSFTYVPTASFTGTVSFTYRAQDGVFSSNIATVTITVQATAAAPTAVNNAYSVNEDNTLTVATSTGVLANDTDPNGDSLSAVLVAGASHGTVSLAANGSFTYIPNANYHGTDTFTYRATDGSLTSNTATVTITVNPVNDAPVGLNDLYTVAVNETLTVDVANGILTNDTDPDGDSLIAHLFSYASHGAVSFNTNGSFVYTPNEDFQGTDTFVYKVYDGETYSGETTVTINVEAVDEAIADEEDWLS